MTVRTAKTEDAVQRQENRHVDKSRWHTKRQPADRPAQELPELPANPPTIITDRSPKYMNEPRCGDNEQHSPSADHPRNSLRRLLIVASIHIMPLGLSLNSVVGRK